MTRLQELVRSIRGFASNVESLDRLSESVAALSSDVAGIHNTVRALNTGVAAARRRTDELLSLAAADAAERAQLAAVPHAELLSGSLFLDASAAQRLRVRRITVGDAIERPFSQWMGITRCVSESTEINALWQRLLGLEAACDDVLRGRPNSVLDVPGATASRDEAGQLRIRLRAKNVRPADPQSTAPDSIVAIPRFTYDFPTAKLRNFGHWLVDCLPHVLALSMVAPRARFLLPDPVRGFHRSLLSLIGVTEQQIVPWQGEPFESDRLLVLESDGRTGGGRPLSGLMQMRRLLEPQDGFSREGRTRRIYVSRRDAEANRSWVSNEPDVEAVFRSRGFEVVVMSECPLDEQIRLFRDAAVVAGVSGAGLTDIVFSAPGIHVVVLLSDSLMHWYSKPGRGRAKWATGARARKEHLAAIGDSPRFYSHLAAACEQFCHSFLSADRVPLGELTAFVDDVLARAGSQ